MTTDLPEWARQGRAGWTYTGGNRPDFAIDPEPGQESVWDYPRPPIAVPEPREVVISFRGATIARSSSAVRVLETASPPTVYIPMADINAEHVRPSSGRSLCEWKGEASYFDVVVGDDRLERVAWTYPEPFPDFASLRDRVAFYPQPLDCTLGGEPVRGQQSTFYAGWITSEVVGPFKGEPGTGGW